MLLGLMTAKTRPETSPRDVLAFLPRQDRHKPKGPEVRKSKVSKWRAAVLIAVHVVIGLHIWHWLATGKTITPVEPSEAMQTVEVGKLNAGFVLFLSLIASTLLFGRWFCGWGCHVVALQDLCAWGLKKIGLKPRPVRSRLLVFAPWVVGGYMFVWPILLNLWNPAEKPLPNVSDWRAEFETTEFWATFPGPIMTVGSILVVGFLIVWWMGAKGFCTYGCPYGAFFTLADRVAPMRIKVNDDCEHCGHCTSVCTSNVRVHEEVARHGQVVDPGCMKCLDCVSVCPKDALSFGFAKPTPLATSQQRIQARSDFRWWEEVLLAVVAFVAVQWTFRSAWFGEGVPLLLSVGLGVITAVFALLFVRMLTRRDVTFQHSVLKQDGKRTGFGTVALLLLGGWLLFTAHTFVGQRLRTSAIAAGGVPVRARLFAPREFDRQAAETALADVRGASSWVLVPDPRLREVQAMLKGTLDQDVDAAHELATLYDEFGTFFYLESRLMLARYWALAGERLQEAEALTLQVIEADADNPHAVMLLNGIRKRLNR